MFNCSVRWCIKGNHRKFNCPIKWHLEGNYRNSIVRFNCVIYAQHRTINGVEINCGCFNRLNKWHNQIVECPTTLRTETRLLCRLTCTWERQIGCLGGPSTALDYSLDRPNGLYNTCVDEQMSTDCDNWNDKRKIPFLCSSRFLLAHAWGKKTNIQYGLLRFGGMFVCNHATIETRTKKKHSAYFIRYGVVDAHKKSIIGWERSECSKQMYAFSLLFFFFFDPSQSTSWGWKRTQATDDDSNERLSFDWYQAIQLIAQISWLNIGCAIDYTSGLNHRMLIGVQ